MPKANTTVPQVRRLRKTREWMVIVIFAVLLILPWLGQHAGLDSRWKLRENRNPAKCPSFSLKWDGISRYPSRFEPYFNDSFGFRSLLTRCRSYMLYFWLHMSPSPQNVVRGGEDRLFMGWPEELLSYQRLRPYRPQQLAQWSHYFEGIRSWLAERHCKLIVMIIPNKSTVYPELMPSMLKRAPAPARADQLIDVLRERGITVIDPRNVFASEPFDSPLYYRYDTHWTPYGAHIGWRLLLEEVYPDVRQPPLSWKRSTTESYTGDLLLLGGLEGFLSEPLIQMARTAPPSLRRIPPHPDQTDWFGRRIVYETDTPGQKRAVLFHDSFAMTVFDDLLTANFSFLAMAWTHIFEPDLVRLHDPDFVIFEILERSLYNDDTFGTPHDILASLHGVEAAVSRPFRVGRNVFATDSLLGAVRRADEDTPAGWLLFGGYRPWTNGRYTARFRLRGAAGVQAELDVSSDAGKRQLAHRTLNPYDLPVSNGWIDVDLPFEILTPAASQVEMRVYYQGGGWLEIESVSLVAR